MKRSELKSEIKSALMKFIFIFLFFFFPLFIMEGIKIALSAILMAVFLCIPEIMHIASMVNSYNKKKPKVTRKNKYFVREIPDDYSVAIASLLISNLFDESVDIPATILSLIGKSVLKYKSKKITAVSNADITNLSEHEKYLYECISKRKKIKAEKFHELVMDDAVNKGYIEKIKLKDYTYLIFNICVAVIVLFCLVTFFVVIFEWSEIIIVVLMAVVFISMFFSPIYFMSKEDVINKNPYKNTNLGQKEFQKLLNLKDYLLEFSDFEKSEIEEAILWEDYVAYAYIFNINKNLLDDFEEIKQLTHLFEEAD